MLWLKPNDGVNRTQKGDGENWVAALWGSVAAAFLRRLRRALEPVNPKQDMINDEELY
jgi:hypothetical protein